MTEIVVPNFGFAWRYSITQGQPYEGAFTRRNNLDVRAGRHASEEVVHDFNADITGDNALGIYASDSLPKELNFAVFGTLSVIINGARRVCADMRIAQGHKATLNNWWIAGTKCYSSTEQLRCPCGHTNLTFFGYGYGFGPDDLLVRSD